MGRHTVTGRYAPQRMLSNLTDSQSRPGRLIQSIFVIEVGWILGAGLWIGLWSGVLTPTDPTRLAAIVTLLTHGVLLAVTLMVVRAAQQRGFWALMGPWEQATGDFIATLVWTGGLAVLLMLWSGVELSSMPDATRAALLPWLLTLPIACAAILMQTAAEEIYFRGFIQSTLAARFSNPLIWMGLPSLFFGLLHWTAEAGPVEATQAVLITTAFGLAAADLTARTGTLGAAIALHFVYNAMLMLLSGVEGDPISGLALYLFPAEIGDEIESMPVLSVEFLLWGGVLAILWLAARNAVRR